MDKFCSTKKGISKPPFAKLLLQKSKGSVYRPVPLVTYSVTCQVIAPVKLLPSSFYYSYFLIVNSSSFPLYVRCISQLAASKCNLVFDVGWFRGKISPTSHFDIIMMRVSRERNTFYMLGPRVPIMKRLSLYHLNFFSSLHFIGWFYRVELELTLLFQVKITKLTQFHLINSPNKV